jgi:hypothetical protein
MLTWAKGFFFEAVGDYQLTQFIKNPANKGKIMTSGLWKYTGCSLLIIRSKKLFLHFFAGTNPPNVNIEVSQGVPTIAGIRAFAHGSISNGSQDSRASLMSIFHGSESHGVHASEITPIDFSFFRNTTFTINRTS